MLMVRTMRALLTQDLGFNPQGVISATLPRPARPPLDPDALAPVHEAEVQVIEAVTQLPGVVAAGVGGSPLGWPWEWLVSRCREIPANCRPSVYACQRRLLRSARRPAEGGTPFHFRGSAGAPMVAVLGESAARKFWPSPRSGQGRVGALSVRRCSCRRTVRRRAGRCRWSALIADMTEWGST